ncbi:MAG TPA: RimK/LysX family protein [Polyangiaceae bacterium]
MRGRRPLVIGAAELVDIPAWGVRDLAAKVDTGARTSALHVENVRELPRGRVRFDVRLHRRHPERRVVVEAAILRRGRVRSTSGDAEPRLFVAVGIRLGPVRKRIELGLVDRKNMIYRMLLGRSALGGSFLVDAGRRFLLTRPRTQPRALAEAKAC